MEIFGIGGWELVAILLIMLIVAGPKRMIAWSYTLGRYVAALRAMWGETARALQREFDQAGVDVQVPQDLPTRENLTREVGRVMSQASRPVREPLESVSSEIRRDLTAVSTSMTTAQTPTRTQNTTRTTAQPGTTTSTMQPGTPQPSSSASADSETDAKPANPPQASAPGSRLKLPPARTGQPNAAQSTTQGSAQSSAQSDGFGTWSGG
jgi:Sec-independent protein translocase protein TatA